MPFKFGSLPGYYTFKTESTGLLRLRASKCLQRSGDSSTNTFPRDLPYDKITLRSAIPFSEVDKSTDTVLVVLSNGHKLRAAVPKQIMGLSRVTCSKLGI